MKLMELLRKLLLTVHFNLIGYTIPLFHDAIHQLAMHKIHRLYHHFDNLNKQSILIQIHQIASAVNTLYKLMSQILNLPIYCKFQPKHYKHVKSR
ncbi:unnamed protein product [Schistosoma margrebowiei]|uniref:Uncharacterized protein n=1 Tax=Schistosoma margrebowiei TaxID=48269 RepID=A0A183MHQ1_9TREM|nr:unnamed protein product [Schistosoma margrebowiei]